MSGPFFEMREDMFDFFREYLGKAESLRDDEREAFAIYLKALATPPSVILPPESIKM